jgi:hypothetical protein
MGCWIVATEMFLDGNRCSQASFDAALACAVEGGRPDGLGAEMLAIFGHSAQSKSAG